MDNTERKIIWTNKTLLEWFGKDRPEDIQSMHFTGENSRRRILKDAMLREVVCCDFGRKKVISNHVNSHRIS